MPGGRDRYGPVGGPESGKTTLVTLVVYRRTCFGTELHPLSAAATAMAAATASGPRTLDFTVVSLRAVGQLLLARPVRRAVASCVTTPAAAATTVTAPKIRAMAVTPTVLRNRPATMTGTPKVR